MATERDTALIFMGEELPLEEKHRRPNRKIPLGRAVRGGSAKLGDRVVGEGKGNHRI
jgi:hypothetical protein